MGIWNVLPSWKRLMQKMSKNKVSFSIVEKNSFLSRACSTPFVQKHQSCVKESESTFLCQDFV